MQLVPLASWSCRLVPAVALALLVACGDDSSAPVDGGDPGVDAAVASLDSGSRDGGGSQVEVCAEGALDLEAYRGTDCFCGDACDCYLDVPYGDRATWVEGGMTLTQAIDLFVPRSPAADAPLVFWAHPNGSTKDFGAAGPLATDVALPLLSDGMLFASVEFRHPANDATPDAPPTDLADAVQFLRCHADTLGFDRERVAAIARSRGTLAIWTALQNDLADPESDDPLRRQSTRLRGVYAISAQTSYWGEWIASTFFDEASQPLVLAQLGPENRGHAVGDASADDPPVHIEYDSPLAELPLRATDCRSAGGDLDCVHLPNFGDELCDAYTAAGIGARCTVRYSVPTARLYQGGAAFLREVLAR
jgi:acetyl esterase/lipase